MANPQRLPAGRILRFASLQLAAAIAPLLVLPAIVHSVGQSGWIGFSIGFSAGAAAAVAINFAWPIIGPPLVAGAEAPHARRVLGESLQMRGLVTVPALIATSALALFLAPQGHRLLAVSMTVATATNGLASNWYFIGRSDAGAILRFETLPRLAATAASVPLVAVSKQPLIYPGLLMVCGLGGTMLGVRSAMGSWRWVGLPWSSVIGRTRRQLPIAAAGIISSSATALAVNIAAFAQPGTAAVANFAAATRLRSMAQAGIATVTSALQGWVSEASTSVWRQRYPRALALTTATGLIAAGALAAGSGTVSTMLFHDSAYIALPLAIALGLSCLAYSISSSTTAHVLAPAGRQRQIVSSTMAGSIIGVPAIYLLTKSFGAVGAMWGCVIAEGTVVALQLLLSLRIGRTAVLARDRPVSGRRADRAGALRYEPIVNAGGKPVKAERPRDRRRSMGGTKIALILVLALLAGVASYFAVKKSNTRPQACNTAQLISFVGDSYTAGAGTDSGASYRYPALVSKAFGAKSQILGFNGSGYVARGPKPFNVTFPEAASRVNANAKVVIVFGSRNDTASAAAVKAAATTTFKTLKTKAPNATIVVIGPSWINNLPNPQIKQNRDAIKSAAAASGVVFNDPLADGWFADPSGIKNGKSTMIAADHIHPTNEGQAYIAGKIKPMLAGLLCQAAS